MKTLTKGIIMLRQLKSISKRPVRFCLLFLLYRYKFSVCVWSTLPSFYDSSISFLIFGRIMELWNTVFWELKQMILLFWLVGTKRLDFPLTRVSVKVLWQHYREITLFFYFYFVNIIIIIPLLYIYNVCVCAYVYICVYIYIVL